MLCRDYKGKEADRLVTRIDPGAVSLVAELHGTPGHNKHAHAIKSLLIATPNPGPCGNVR